MLCLCIMLFALNTNAQAPIVFYPPSGVTIVSPVEEEYQRGCGDFQNATVTPLSGGSYKIDLSSPTGIGINRMLGTANANPSYSPLVQTLTVTNGCDSKVSTNFTVIILPVIDSVSIACIGITGTADVTILTSVSSGTLEYGLDASAYQSSDLFNAVANESHTISVRIVNLSCNTSQGVTDLYFHKFKHS